MALLRSCSSIAAGCDYKDFAPTEHVSGPVKCPNSRGVACNAVDRQAEKGLNRHRRQCREGTASNSPPGYLEICK